MYVETGTRAAGGAGRWIYFAAGDSGFAQFSLRMLILRGTHDIRDTLAQHFRGNEDHFFDGCLNILSDCRELELTMFMRKGTIMLICLGRFFITIELVDYTRIN